MSIASINYALADDDVLYNTKSAAHFLGYDHKSLERWRGEGTGPVYIKGPGRRGRVFYPRSALLAWRASRTYRSTSEY